MSDLISRNDAVKAIEFEKVYMTAYKGSSNGYVSEGNPLKQYNKGLDDAIKAINSLAPAESEWIPVSEALPEKHQRVLVTIRRSDGEYRVRSGNYSDEYFWIDNGDHWKCNEALAWMPLPEPYRGDR